MGRGIQGGALLRQGRIEGDVPGVGREGRFRVRQVSQLQAWWGQVPVQQGDRRRVCAVATGETVAQEWKLVQNTICTELYRGSFKVVPCFGKGESRETCHRRWAAPERLAAHRQIREVYVVLASAYKSS